MGSGIRLEGLESNGLAKQFALCSGFRDVLPAFREPLRLGNGVLGSRYHGLPRPCLARRRLRRLDAISIATGEPTIVKRSSERGLVGSAKGNYYGIPLKADLIVQGVPKTGIVETTSGLALGPCVQCQFSILCSLAKGGKHFHQYFRMLFLAVDQFVVDLDKRVSQFLPTSCILVIC